MTSQRRPENVQDPISITLVTSMGDPCREVLCREGVSGMSLRDLWELSTGAFLQDVDRLSPTCSQRDQNDPAEQEGGGGHVWDVLTNIRIVSSRFPS